MPVNPAFLAARAAEQRQRLISYLPEAEPLALPLASGRVVSVRQVHLTLRIEAELDLIENPMIAGGKATRLDAFRFLWRHHPRFMRAGTLPNAGHRQASFWEALRSRLTRLWLAWICGRLAWPLAAVCLSERLKLSRLDSGGSTSADDAPAPAAPPHCSLDEFCRLFLPRGLNRDAVLDSPLSWLFQQLRADALAGPDGELAVIDPSDALLGA